MHFALSVLNLFPHMLESRSVQTTQLPLVSKTTQICPPSVIPWSELIILKNCIVLASKPLYYPILLAFGNCVEPTSFGLTFHQPLLTWTMQSCLLVAIGKFFSLRKILLKSSLIKPELHSMQSQWSISLHVDWNYKMCSHWALYSNLWVVPSSVHEW